MNNKKFLLLLVLILPITTYALDKSPFKACENVVLVKESEYKADKQEWDAKFVKCKGVNFQIVPDGKLFATSYNESSVPNLEQSLSAIDFLTQVGQKTVETIKSNIAKLQTSQKCLEEKTPSDKELSLIGKDLTCQKLVDSIKIKMKENTPALRSELSFLGQINLNHAETALKTLDSSKLIDSTLNNSGGLIAGGVPHAKFKPLTDAEKQNTKKIYDEELKAIRQKWVDQSSKEIYKNLISLGLDPNTNQFKTQFQLAAAAKEKKYADWGRSQLYENQKIHEAKYMAVAGNSPFLLHVGNENPTNVEIATSIPKLISSAKEELKRSEEALNSAAVNFGKYNNPGRSSALIKQEKIDDLLYFLGNTPIIEDVLSNNNKGCSTMNGLVNFVTKQKTSNQLVLMSAVFGGMYLLATKVPALLTAATGITWSSAATGAMFGAPLGIYMEQLAYKEAVIAKDKYNSGVGDLKDVKKTSDDLAIQTLLHPLDYIGIGAVVGKAAKMTEVMAMQRAGMSDSAIKNIVRLSESADIKISLPAKKEIARYGWGEILGKKPNESEMNLLQKLIDSGSIPKESKNVKIEQTLKLIQQLNAEEQKGLAFINSLNPKGAQVLLSLHESISKKPGNHSELLLTKLEAMGIPKPMAKKMCLCARVCSIKTADYSPLSENLVCSL
ncbi:MAG: hypothetical protein K2Q18_16760 [Bdellovibrionales bacterium]|nr:hypothetical protein [Bdellovibrionales bacterium]